MNLLAPDTAAGRAARLPLKLLPASRQMRMLAPGPLRGARWIAGAGVHGCWLGSYERSKRRVFIDEARPGYAVIDVGAQAGYYSLLAARLVGPTGVVVAVEPLPRNLVFLRRHLELNEISNVTVVAAAASDRVGTAAFEAEDSSYMGRLSPSGSLAVEVVPLDMIAEAESIRPQVVKIDVEGAEAEVLEGAHRILTKDRPVIFLATHGSVPHEESCAILTGHGYELSPLDADSLADAREILARPGRLR